MPATANRRWFRFSIRTLLLVVTLLACWLGVEKLISRQRQNVRALVESQGGYFVHSDRYRFNVFNDWQELQVALPESKFSDEQAKEVKRLFPESAVWIDRH